MQTKLDTPNFYLPSRVPVITEREAQQLETIIPMDIKKLDSISTRLLAQRQTYDVDSQFQQHRTYKQHEQQTQWYMTVITAIGVAIFLGLTLFLLYTHFQKLRCYFFRAPSNHDTPAQISSFLSQGKQYDAIAQKDSNAEREVVFASSASQPTNEQKDVKAERVVVFASYTMQPTH